MRYIYCFFFCLQFFFYIFISLNIFIRLHVIYAPGQLRQHTEIIQREPGEAATASNGATAVTAAATTIDALARNGCHRPAIPVSCRSVSSTNIAYGQPVPTRSQYWCTKSVGPVSAATDYVYTFCYDSVARYVLISLTNRWI